MKKILIHASAASIALVAWHGSIGPRSWDVGRLLAAGTVLAASPGEEEQCPEPTGLRFCVNSASLEFEKKKK